MKSLICSIVSVLLWQFCWTQSPYPFIAANNEIAKQNMFYPNTCVLIQKQELTESSLKGKLNGKWRCLKDTNWHFTFDKNSTAGRFSGFEFITHDTINYQASQRDTCITFNEYFVTELTDTVRNWDTYRGSGFYIRKTAVKNFHAPEVKYLDGRNFRNNKFLYDTKYREWYFPVDDPKCDCSDSRFVIFDYSSSERAQNDSYKILEIYDNSLVISSQSGNISIFERVN